MATAGLLILFFKLYQEDRLEQEIKETEVSLKHLITNKCTTTGKKKH
jgi:hypothetical protein